MRDDVDKQGGIAVKDGTRDDNREFIFYQAVNY